MKKILLTAINAKYIHSNLAVYDLKAYAEKYMDEEARREIEIYYREFTINHLVDEILQELYKEKPDVLCFSCYIWNISYVKTLAVEMKKLRPQMDIWLGGPEVSYHAKEVLEELPQVRGIIRGEGEKIFTNVCNAYAMQEKMAEKDISSIRGIVFRKGEELVETPAEELVELSDVPFVYENMEGLENRIIYYESSRGCPFSCSYCLSSATESVRFRDMRMVKRELQHFIDCGAAQVKFVDRTFNCKKKHAMEIWQYIYEHDRGMTNFHFEIGADLLDEEELALLAKMRPGLVQLEIGVQSVNEKTIHEVSRKMDLDKLEYAVRQVRAARNINLHLDLIAGLPYENLESFKTSFDRIYRMYPDQLQLGFLKLLYGSALEWQQENYGIVHKSYPPYEVLYTRWLSYDDILILKNVENMVENYYNSGQFTQTLRFLEDYFERPFDFFYRLGCYYETHFDKSVKHSRMDRYRILRAFAAERLDAEDVEILDEIMSFDIYLRENMKTRPEFAKEVGAYRQLFRSVTAMCKLTQREHVEIISEKVWKKLELSDVSVENKELGLEIPKDCVLLYFDYNERNVLNYNGKVYRITC